MKKSAASPISRRLFWLASLMFFLSGGTGLAYQVIWFRRFSHVWGSSSLAFASVGASFLFGLGVGAWLFGRYADSFARPLRWYGVCELAIGLAALAISFEIQGLVRLSAGFYTRLPDEPLLRYLVQFCLTLVVVGPPCVLMGGTLPLLIRELTARDGALDEATGWLYAINTFGAAAGCYVASFQLLPTIGLLWTNNLAAGVNIAIGLAAVALSLPAPGRQKQKAAAPATVAPAAGKLAMAKLYIAVALAGLAALVLEMTWSRQLALALGGSTYAYSATLFVVLIGIASGSLLFHLGLRRLALNPWLPTIVIGTLAIACLAGRSSLPWLSSQVAVYHDARQSLLGNAAVCVAASALLEFIPALAMGILFPLFVDLTHAQAARVGRTVGNVYAWNTFGSILGASLTAVVLFPRIGTAGAVALATGLYIATLLLVLPIDSLRDRARAAGSLAVGCAVVAAIMIPQDPLRTNVGAYLYGSQDTNLDKLKCLYFVEGASSSVLVASYADQARSLRVNGKPDASDDSDMVTQLGLAYVPRLFCRRAQDVLVIGFGSGTTLGATLLFPNTRVTCCEIEPAVYGAASYFSHVNHRPQEQTRQFLIARNAELPPEERLSDEEIDRRARLKMVFGDGRTQLQGDDQKYDLIISEPSNPWLAGVSSLFTREFFQAAKEHLHPGGVLAQWIQTYHFTLDDYLMIVRTMRGVFPHCGLIALSHGVDTLLLASDEPLLPDRVGLEHMQHFVDRSPEISADLREWFDTTDLRILLLSRYAVPQARLDKMVDEASTKRVNTDLNMRLEFEAPLHMFERLPVAVSAEVQLANLADSRWMARLASLVGVLPAGAEYQMALGLERLAHNQTDAAIPFLQQAIELKPDLSDAYRTLARAYAKRHKQQDALAVWQRWVTALPDSAEARLGLFNAYIAAGEHAAALRAAAPLLSLESVTPEIYADVAMRLLNQSADAAAYARKALQLKPSLALDRRNLLWVNNFAWLLATNSDPAARNGEDAIRWARMACEAVNYDQWTVLDTLAAAYAEAGQFDEALKIMQQVLDRALREGDTTAADVARRRLTRYRANQPCREQDEVVIKAP